MKNFYTFLVAIFTFCMVNAQSPEKISYQAFVKNSSQQPLTSQAVGLRVSLLQNSVTGTIVYTETHSTTTDSNAMVSIEIGDGVTTDELSLVNWGADAYFTKIEFDINNDGIYDLENTSQLLSVPYALNAKTAESVTNVSGVNTGDQDISGISINAAAIADNIVFTTTNNVTSAGDEDDDFVFGSTQLSDISGSNDNNRIFFDKSKGAFRAGNSLSTNWDDTNVGEFSMAMGHNTTASGTASFALGWNSIASGSQAVSIGNNSNAEGYSATAMGEKTTAESYGQTTLGLYNTAQTGNQTAHITSDRLLVVGNGYDESNRSDAMVVLKSGNTVINGELKANKLEVDGAFTLPTSDGNANQILSTNGSGVVTWVDETIPTITKYAIGDVAQGGVVYWVDETGQHGLVVSMVNQSLSARWYAGTNGNTQAKGAGIYAGKQATSIIIAAHVAIGDDGNTYAARLCNEYEFSQNGVNYGDWYLPSRSELYLMYQNGGVISPILQANGGEGFTGPSYWSSTEVDSDGASQMFFDYLFVPDERNKSSLHGVRAIRLF